uniref:POLXc domain-containing protein n=1 Tax=Rhabditophanes sp. KR3021 TaxID=114890 RepID=A0AC35UD64_9BILA
MNVAALQSMNKKEIEDIPLRKIKGIEPKNEEKLRKSKITTSTLFEKYITINKEVNYKPETAKAGFTLYLEQYNVTKNDGKMIFKHIYSKGQNLLSDSIGTIVSPAAKTLKEVIQNAIRDISLRHIKGIGPRNEEKLRKSKITTSKLFDEYIKINEKAKYDLKLAKSRFTLYLEQYNVTKSYGEMIFEDIYSILQIYELHLHITRTAERPDTKTLIPGMNNTLKNTPIKDFESILEENESIICDNERTIAEVVEKLITIDQESNHDILKTQTAFIDYLEFLEITEGSRFRIFIQCYTLVLTYMLLNGNNHIKIDVSISSGSGTFSSQSPNCVEGQCVRVVVDDPIGTD